MIKRLFPLAALLLLVASCTSAIDNVENLRLRAGADSNLPVFYATIEGSDEAATKVYADDQMSVLWNADDRSRRQENDYCHHGLICWYNL